MWKTRGWLVGGAVMMGGAALAAQSPQSTTSREVISATGCVRVAGPENATGEGIGTGYVLKGVRVAPNVGLVEAPRLPPARTPSAGAAESDGSLATDTTEPGSAAPPDAARVSGVAHPDTGLLLVADRGVDLAEHVGHRVLVTGRLSSFAAAGGVASTSSGRTLTVTRVSLIAPACTTGS